VSKIELVVFDLDGTLIASHETIFNSTLKSLKDLNIETDFIIEEFKPHIGLHFVDIFSNLGFKVDDFNEYISIYKKYYFDFIDSSKFYPNVTNTIQELNSSSIKLALLTTKAQGEADRILEHFKIHDMFDLVMGHRDGIANKPDAEPLLFICNELNVDPQNTLMVGDSEMDIRCGKNAGALTCAVTFGYRSIEQIELEKPDFIINDLAEINDII
jgi:HAD superfamily hydrolase (TIGR01662 family)